MSTAHGLRTADATADSIAGVDPYCHDATAAAVARLAEMVEAQARVIRHHEAAMARSRDIFERATAAARLGLWECDLTSETLQWSGGTYDMFGIARDTPLKRKQTLACYPAESLTMLETVRTRAIAERNGFNLDARIVTPDGNTRWIRITATVACAGDRPTRLFGLKQDITEEKERWDRTLYRAEFDELTGLANRGQFQMRLAEACGDASDHGAGGALLLVDLDGFKEVNDSLGHAAGDECLKTAAQRLAAACGTATIVARVGGDEFAVLLGPLDRGAPVLLAKQIIAVMGRPIRCGWHRFQIGASVGLTPLRGCRSDEAFKRADAALYAAKAGGRNTFRWFDPATMRI
jgi:diguanylate cyclase (GGDEF)-like protein/PAS domain S-box-containing protein